MKDWYFKSFSYENGKVFDTVEELRSENRRVDREWENFDKRFPDNNSEEAMMLSIKQADRFMSKFRKVIVQP